MGIANQYVYQDGRYNNNAIFGCYRNNLFNIVITTKSQFELNYVYLPHNLRQDDCPMSYDKTAYNLNLALGADPSCGLFYNL